MKELLLDYDPARLTDLIGPPAFRARQLYRWLTLYRDFGEMTDLARDLRARLEERYIACPLRIAERLVSRDGTVKYLYELGDGNVIEGVFMRYKYGNTLCVSTQVGCRMGCTFCATGLDGLIRNLSAGEILAQVLAVNRDQGGDAKARAVTNVVLMGMGEPLDNYDQTMKFLTLVSSPEGIRISPRNISLSTCGLADRIRRFADESRGVNLTISLHAATDEARREIMPVARRYSLAEVIGAARYYFERTGRRVIFEYVMIENRNMADRDAERLALLLRGFPSHVNLIMLNGRVSDSNRAASRARAEVFCQKLVGLGLSATVRRSLGADIEGACGQLRLRRRERLR